MSENKPEPLWRRIWGPVSTILAIIALIDLSKQLIEWAKFFHTIAGYYASSRDFVFSHLPFHIPKYWHDAIVLLTLTFTTANFGYYRKTGHHLLEQMALSATFLFWNSASLLCKMVKTLDIDKLLAKFPPELARRVQLDRLNKDKIFLLCDKIIGWSDALECRMYIYAEFSQVPASWPKNRIMNHPYVVNTVGMLVLLGSLTFFIAAIVLVSSLSLPGFLTMGVIALILGILIAWQWVLATLVAFLIITAANEIYIHWLMPR